MAGLPLIVLKHINILGDALDLRMIALRLVVQREEVKSVRAGAPCLEDDQWQAGRVGSSISDETLLLFASTAMLTSERFPRANDDW